SIPRHNKVLKGEIVLTASKSESNRLLLIRALCDSSFTIHNLAAAKDTQTMIEHLQSKGDTWDVGPAGTTMRFLTAYAALQQGNKILTGSERMRNRPIKILVDALRTLGADIQYMEKEGCPPLNIQGGKLKGGEISIDGSVSSQFITALLLLAPTLETGLILHIKNEPVSKPYIKMTIEVLNQFGINAIQTENKITVPHGDYKKDGLDYYLESDWSSASYWYSIAALSENAEIKLFHFNKASLQSDSVIAELYTKLGVKTQWSATGITLTKQALEINEFTHDFIDYPDVAQTIAATCVGLGIKAHLRGLQTLKLKETDRILAMKNELEKFGAQIEISDSSMKIIPSEKIISPLSPIQTYHDHRMAMSIAPLVLKTETLLIQDPDVVNKSYAAFWDDLQEAGIDVE
ncbi:MAG: 3-phosphoshikimate 1-carboxyvinyltransferase, partial [Bacteroidota bacterium]